MHAARWLPASLAALSVLTPGPPAAAQRRPVLDQIKVPHDYYFREMYLPQLTTGPSAATWSPDGNTLIYSMAGSLWRQDADGTEAVQLTDGPGYDYQPDWSPDGRRVVYASYRQDAIELRMLDLSSGADHALLANGAVNVEPRWSPAGDKVAFVSTAFEGRWHIHVLNVADGTARGSPERITVDHDSRLPRYYYSVFDHFISPAWSPDGRELLLVSNAGRIWGSGGFWRMNASAGAAPRQIHYEETTWRGSPDWAPDGKRVVYSSYLGRQWHQLWLMTSDGGDPLQLTYGDFDATSPRWSPDGRRIAFISNRDGNTALAVITVPSGEIIEVRPAVRRYRLPRNSVRIEVTGPAGTLVPARVSVTGPDGRGRMPADAWVHADDGFDRRERPFEYSYFHSAGTSRLELAPGRYVVEVSRGYEFARRVDTITVGTAARTHRVRLRRLTDLTAKGWYSGDLHVHMNYGGRYRNTPRNLRFQAEAEDLRVVENLIVNKEQRIPDIGYFAGPLDRISTATTLIKHDEEYHTSWWGHTGLIGLERFFIMPNYAGYVNTAAASLYPHNARIAELARGQGGLAGYVHPFESVPDFDRGETTTSGFPIEAALGRIDYLEVVGFSDHFSTAAIWYRLLNTGVKLPAGAGTDAMANFASLRGPVGMGRVYVRSGRLDYRTWLAALKAGRSFATNGPILEFALGGQGIGATIALPGADSLTAVVSMRSITAVDSLQIVRNGAVVATIPLAAGGTAGSGRVRLPVSESGWYIARAFSRTARHPTLDIHPFATTSPIYVTVAGRPIRSAEDARYFGRWLDQLEGQVTAHPGWNTDQERNQVLADLHTARRFFEDRAR